MAVSPLKKPEVTQHSASTSFANMSISQYARNALENLRQNISNYTNGIHNVSSTTGPQYFVHLGKTNDNYWSAMLQSYNDEYIYFARYSDGTCTIKVI